jgi:hypothetical protein
MKLEKKHWVIIGVVVAIIVIWYFFFKKKKPAESSYNADYMCRMRGCKGVRPNGRCYGCRPLRESAYSGPKRPPFGGGTGPTNPIPPTPEALRSGTVFCAPPNKWINGKCVPEGTAKTYVYTCDGPPATSGWSDKSSGNCVGKGKETIIKVLA